MNKKISLIVACDKNYLIGNNNKLPWHLPADLEYFKQKTLNKSVVMGRITFESILEFLGKPLPNRKNIVLTRTKNKNNMKEIFFVHNLKEAINLSKDNKEIFIIGGASIYKQALEKGMVDRIYLTLIDSDFKGNIFFPKIFLKKFKKVSEQKYKKDEKNKYNMNFIIFEKI